MGGASHTPALQAEPQRLGDCRMIVKVIAVSCRLIAAAAQPSAVVTRPLRELQAEEKGWKDNTMAG